MAEVIRIQEIEPDDYFGKNINGCISCKHDQNSFLDYPCIQCHSRNKWEEK
jgi:hypothetical protein